MGRPSRRIRLAGHPAVDRRYVRPTVNSGKRIAFEACRHPVVESMSLDEPFVPNDIVLDENRRLIILTGPNMAGEHGDRCALHADGPDR